MDERMILIHGFTREDTMKILKAVKGSLDDPAGIAFSVTTETNQNWKVSDLIREVRDEHEYMRKNPPGSSGPVSE